MIRINLLPVRAAQKKEQLRSQVVVLVLVVVATLAVCVAGYVAISAKVEAAQADLANKQAEIQRLKSVIGEVGKFETEKKKLTAKLEILDKLKENRIGPVRVLDELSRAVPEKVWVESFTQDSSNISIKGIGLNQESVADFMRQLESSSFFQGVELEVIDQKIVNGRTLENFSIRCVLESPQVKTAEKGVVGK